MGKQKMYLSSDLDSKLLAKDTSERKLSAFFSKVLG